MWFCWWWWCLGGHCRWGGRNLRGCCCCGNDHRSVSRRRLRRLSRGLFGSRKHILVTRRSRTLVDFSRGRQGSNTTGGLVIWTIFWSVLTARILAIRDLHFCCSFDYIKESASWDEKKMFNGLLGQKFVFAYLTQRARKFKKVQAKKTSWNKKNPIFPPWNCIFDSFETFSQFKNWFLDNFEIGKNGIWPIFFSWNRYIWFHEFFWTGLF